MLQQHDTLLVLIILFLILMGIVRYLLKTNMSQHIENHVDSDEIMQLLTQAGYTAIRSKIRIPIRIHCQDQSFDTRLFIDGVVKKDGCIYALRIHRPRKPLQYSGSSIRDLLLPIFLIGKWDGVVYLDTESGSVTCFTFDINRSALPVKISWFPFLLAFIAGMIITLIIE
jgi:hypothetical protein